MPSRLFYLHSLDRSIFNITGVRLVFTITMFYRFFFFFFFFVFNANSVDSDQTPRSVVSDLDLYCLPMSLL